LARQVESSLIKLDETAECRVFKQSKAAKVRMSKDAPAGSQILVKRGKEM
jgi:hypothetical protein